MLPFVVPILPFVNFWFTLPKTIVVVVFSC